MQNFLQIYMKMMLTSRFHLDNICDKIIMCTFKNKYMSILSTPPPTPGLNQQWHRRHTILKLGDSFHEVIQIHFDFWQEDVIYKTERAYQWNLN